MEVPSIKCAHTRCGRKFIPNDPKRRFCEKICKDRAGRVKNLKKDVLPISAKEISDLDRTSHEQLDSLIELLVRAKKTGLPTESLSGAGNRLDRLLKTVSLRERAKGRTWSAIGADLGLVGRTIRSRFDPRGETRRAG
jgi:hypothetical protein